MTLSSLRESLLACLACLALATPAWANRVVTATSANFTKALASLKPGDTLQLQGTFSNRMVVQNRDFGGVVFDASQAVMAGGLALRNVQNVNLVGGTFGSKTTATSDWYALRVEESSNISLANINVVGRQLSNSGGVLIKNSPYSTVRDSLFDGLTLGVQFMSSPNSLVVRNSFVNGVSDGINIVDSSRTIVANNSCTMVNPFMGAHPDCIQMWSLVGKPVQSDIFILNNTAIGSMQGFTSFDPKPGSGSNITFAGNYAAINYTQALACNGCTNSLFQDNVLVALPGAQWNVGLNTPNGVGNVFSNNLIYDLRNLPANSNLDQVLPPRLWSALVPNIAGMVGSANDDRSYQRVVAQSLRSSSIPVPEPATWLLMGLGFALMGRQLRERQSQRTVLA